MSYYFMYGERATLYQQTVGISKGCHFCPVLAYLMFEEFHAPYTFRQNTVAPKGVIRSGSS
jgi:hypothetical protein